MPSNVIEKLPFEGSTSACKGISPPLPLLEKGWSVTVMLRLGPGLKIVPVIVSDVPLASEVATRNPPDKLG